MKSKKILALLLCLVLACSMLAGCGNKGGKVEARQLTELEQQEVRLALGLLVDRNNIADLRKSGASVENSFVPNGCLTPDGSNFADTNGVNRDGSGYFSTDDVVGNIDKAMEILSKYYDIDDDGMITNFPTIDFKTRPGEAYEATATAIKEDFAAVGIDMTIAVQDWNVYLPERKAGNYTFGYNGWFGDFNDPMTFLDMWTSTSGNNDAQLGKLANTDVKMYGENNDQTWAEVYDPLITAAKSAPTNEERNELMHKAEDLIMSTGALMVFGNQASPYMLNTGVEGFYQTASGAIYFGNAGWADGSTEMTICAGPEPESIDPGDNSSVDGMNIIMQGFSGLLKWAPDANGNVQLTTDCAESYEVSEDGKTYTFKLKDGLKWSNGEPLLASDFVKSWERAASEELASSYGFLFYEMQDEDGNINAVADDAAGTIVCNLKYRVGYYDQLFAFATFFPVYDAENATKDWVTTAETYVTNGPFKMTSHTLGSEIVWEKNEYYHDKENVKLDKLTMALSDDDNAKLNNYNSGEYAYVLKLPPEEIANLKATKPDEYASQFIVGIYYFSFNVNADLSPVA